MSDWDRLARIEALKAAALIMHRDIESEGATSTDIGVKTLVLAGRFEGWLQGGVGQADG